MSEKSAVSHDEDFTEAHYREILVAARSGYRFATYDDIPWGERFVLWRHDVDISLNRSLRLAEIEAEVGVVATYFVDIHSTFYNAFEAAQSSLLCRILSFGHRLGVHFDANYYAPADADELEVLVGREASLLGSTFAARVDAMSFHNPSSRHLEWVRERYAGLVNCYSQRLRDGTAYCSDSKGYWRYRRLYDVVSEGADPRLQVLTHPGLWQRDAMPPRQRLARAVSGRAEAVMLHYDSLTEAMGRVNLSGWPDGFADLRRSAPDDFSLLDLLWNQGRLGSLVIELCRIVERSAAAGAYVDGAVHRHRALAERVLRSDEPGADELRAAVADLVGVVVGSVSGP